MKAMNHIIRRMALAASGLIIALGLVVPQDSLAGHKHQHKKMKRHDGHGVHRGHDGHRAPAPYRLRSHGPWAGGHFQVPRRIVLRHDAHLYRPYLDGRVYSRPHRHYHDVYAFPVRSGRGWVAQPYAYCSGQLYGGVSLTYRSPRFTLVAGW